MLEATQHTFNSFVTLTYDDAKLPFTCGAIGVVNDKVPNGLPTLEPAHITNFLKRFRKEIRPHKIRYFAVGEYGDAKQRPHYHLALFGWPTCAFGQTSIDLKRQPDPTCCNNCRQLYNLWGHGNIYSGSLENASASYIAGYVTKKLTRPDDPRLLGRNPEFARMSLRPGLGLNAMHDVADVLLTLDAHKTQADVPSSLRHGKLEKPLGRYLQRSLRKMCGLEPNAPRNYEREAEVLNLLQDSINLSKEGEFISLKKLLLDTNKGAHDSFVARYQIHKQRKTL